MTETFHPQQAPLRPGIVYFLTPDGTAVIPPAWSDYFKRLYMAATRHGLKVATAQARSSRAVFSTVTRRFNIGNLNLESIAYIRGNGGPTMAMASLEGFLDNVSWVVDSLESGDADLTAEPDYDCMMLERAPVSRSVREDSDACMAEAPREGFFRRMTRLGRPKPKPAPSEETLEEEALLRSLDAEQRQMMMRLTELISDYVRRYNEMPPIDEFMASYRGKFIVSTDPLQPFSPVVVNKHLDIVLPHYNEVTLKLTPLPKILYLLFLLHPEGMRLKELPDYRRELEELYLLVKPGADEKLARRSIADLCNPISGSVNQKLSMIRRVVRDQLTVDSIVSHYCISGERGERYSLPAASGTVMLPAILQR